MHGSNLPNLVCPLAIEEHVGIIVDSLLLELGALTGDFDSPCTSPISQQKLPVA